MTVPGPLKPVATPGVAEQLRTLGVARSGVLLVHTSYRAVRPVEGGPEGLIQALRDALGPDGTVVMASWPDEDGVFDPASTPADPDLGIVAQIFWQMPGVLRSDHPHAFAAAGPQASSILRDGLPLPPHIPASPVGRVHDLDGQVLLLGVDHDANTTIHLAECMARVPYGVPKYCTVLRSGRPVRVAYRENDHCCGRFRLAGDWLREEGLEAVGPVGHGLGRLVRSRDVTNTVLGRLAADPMIFLHPPTSGCRECDEARASASDAPMTWDEAGGLLDASVPEPDSP
jgi:aminoglycoside 3-N-acetyltransferase